jgi:hypothetical protein
MIPFYKSLAFWQALTYVVAALAAYFTATNSKQAYCSRSFWQS